jgi:hypothetical protein
MAAGGALGGAAGAGIGGAQAEGADKRLRAKMTAREELIAAEQERRAAINALRSRRDA